MLEDKDDEIADVDYDPEKVCDAVAFPLLSRLPPLSGYMSLFTLLTNPTRHLIKNVLTYFCFQVESIYRESLLELEMIHKQVGDVISNCYR